MSWGWVQGVGMWDAHSCIMMFQDVAMSREQGMHGCAKQSREGQVAAAAPHQHTTLKLPSGSSPCSSSTRRTRGCPQACIASPAQCARQQRLAKHVII